MKIPVSRVLSSGHFFHVRAVWFFFLISCCALTSIAIAQVVAPRSFKVGDFEFVRPNTWGWIEPSSAMRRAELQVPADEGVEPGEVTFFHFGAGQGGSVQDNVQRWLAQFSDPEDAEVGEVKIGNTSVVFVRAEGTFLSGMPGTPPVPKEGFAVLGAIMVSAQGDVYVKMTGPAEVVNKGSADFETMVRQAAAVGLEE
ncbi:MAG: hypothetical protein ACFCU3_05175 [Verrucomicrobiales bacterium]